MEETGKKYMCISHETLRMIKTSVLLVFVKKGNYRDMSGKISFSDKRFKLLEEKCGPKIILIQMFLDDLFFL